MNLLNDTIARIAPLDGAALRAARARQAQLTKPAGSLGRLEDLAVQIAGITGQARPQIRQPAVIVMAADHGVAGQGVSAYPAEVTPQMVQNFLHGGAAINVLARHAGARVLVVDMGVASPLPPHPDLLDRKIALGTRDFSIEPAMTRDQARQAVEAGITVVSDAVASGADLIATGDMGIGNTTASSAIVAAITGEAVAHVTGRGTGVDDSGLARKVAVIERALALHRPDPTDGLDVLSKLGGFEIGGLAGVIIGAAALRVPIVIDGFISGAAALTACALAPAAQPYLIAGHRSVERGHAAVFTRLDLHPLLDLGMRLGEGTGAVLAQSLCMAACKALDEMATFGEAGVSRVTQRVPDQEPRTETDHLPSSIASPERNGHTQNDELNIENAEQGQFSVLNSQFSISYPITLINLRDAPVVVVGGGAVGERKVRGLLEARAAVRVISPAVTPELRMLAASAAIEWQARPYQPGDLAGARLVFAATDQRAVNAQVADDAEALGLLCNIADDPQSGGFHLPAVYREPGLTVAVSTEGASPARAKRVRDAIAAWLSTSRGEREEP